MFSNKDKSRQKRGSRKQNVMKKGVNIERRVGIEVGKRESEHGQEIYEQGSTFGLLPWPFVWVFLCFLYDVIHSLSSPMKAIWPVTCDLSLFHSPWQDVYISIRRVHLPSSALWSPRDPRIVHWSCRVSPLSERKPS